MMRQSDIAAVIERDLLRAEVPKPAAVTCFMCGRGMTYCNSRFCSDRCRAYYDIGGAAVGQDWLRSLGLKGFPIDCAHCRKGFDSKGLRCCSTECERRYRERQENLAVMAEVGMEPTPKRLCECGAAIPKFRKGRQVSSATRFCSPKCAQRARQRSQPRKSFWNAETVKKCPIYGGRLAAAKQQAENRDSAPRR